MNLKGTVTITFEVFGLTDEEKINEANKVLTDMNARLANNAKIIMIDKEITAFENEVIYPKNIEI